MGQKPASKDSVLFAVLSHLSAFAFPVIIPALVLLLKGKDDKFVKYHCLQALIYQVSFMVLWFLFVILIMIASILTFGIGAFILVPFGFVLFFVYVGYALYASYLVYSGKEFSYPLLEKIVQKYV